MVTTLGVPGGVIEIRGLGVPHEAGTQIGEIFN